MDLLTFDVFDFIHFLDYFIYLDELEAIREFLKKVFVARGETRKGWPTINLKWEQSTVFTISAPFTIKIFYYGSMI
jgi:hypothetical protein